LFFSSVRSRAGFIALNASSNASSGGVSAEERSPATVSSGVASRAMDSFTIASEEESEEELEEELEKEEE
jgi:hypothetical protein